MKKQTVRLEDYGNSEAVREYGIVEGGRTLASRGASTGWQWDRNADEMTAILARVTVRCAVCG